MSIKKADGRRHVVQKPCKYCGKPVSCMSTVKSPAHIRCNLKHGKKVRFNR